MRTDLRKLTPTQRSYVLYVLAYKRAYHRAGIEYREELALLAKTHREQIMQLARFYDEQLKDDFALLAAAHREELRRRAIAEAQAERALNPFQPLH